METVAKPTLTLTLREKEIMDLLCQAKPRDEIAVKLGIAVSTVAFHMAGILEKSHCRNGRDFARRYLMGEFTVVVDASPRCYSNRKKMN